MSKVHGQGGPALPPIPADIDKKPESLVQLACKLSLDSGSFVDTKFFAYARRSQAGMIYSPKAVYASSWMLRSRAPEYFENLLNGGYDGNCVIGSLEEPIPQGQESLDAVDSLGYDSDSDIEDDDDDIADGVSASASTAPANVKEEQERSGSKGSGKKTSGLDDSDKDPEDSTKSTLGQQGRVVILHNFAYPTWKAFIYYLYTGKVNFATLKSQKAVPPSADAIKRQQLSIEAPPCSPKSMYRLADELGLSELRQLAEKDIQSKLTKENILSELFSTFTSRYDAVRDLEIAFVCDKAKDVLKNGMADWLNGISVENVKRNVGVIGFLVQKLATAPTPAAVNVTPRPTSCQYCSRSGSNFYLRCGSCNNNL